VEDTLGRLEADRSTLTRSTPIWREADELLRSVPGVGRSRRARSSPICRNSATWIADALPALRERDERVRSTGQMERMR
jgi:hypothetical protein